MVLDPWPKLDEPKTEHPTDPPTENVDPEPTEWRSLIAEIDDGDA